jgi:peptide/nickel transport system substrate-binding protein
VFLCLATLAFATASSVPASPKAPRTDTFRIGTTGASWQIDPALSYISNSWEFEYATCAKLLNYPDTPWDEHNASRLSPEIAAGMPTISADQLTYTFQIRNDFQFSPPDNSFVTADSMKYTFERTLNHDMASPAQQFFGNIVGATEYMNGQAAHISGIVASGDTLTIQLIQPQGDFLTFLAMPFLCAVPNGLPPVEQLGPIPSAGPYYISSFVVDQTLVASHNPNYHGPRPQRFDALEYDFNLNEETAYQQVLSGELDEGPVPAADVVQTGQLYGPDSPAAARGLQQFFPEPTSCVGYIPLNTERPTFADANMRKAVNYAIDRTAYTDAAGPYAGSPFDQLLPPGMPGYEDIQAYPDHPDIEHARDLANWHPGDPLRPITVYYRTGAPSNQEQAQIVRQNLIDIGFDPTMVGFAGGGIYTAIGTRGEPFDLAVSIGTCEDYHDPWDFISLYDGTTIHDGQGNTNYSYFNDPVFNDRMHAANELSGDARYDAFQQIEHDLVLNAAPSAAVRTYNNRYFFSQRIGCQHLQGGASYGIDLVQLCVRPAITTDDTSILEPALGTTTVPVTVSLSSEMDNPVSVDYSTQDGTAHAGEDYVATSGTVMFAPHERVKTVSVTINSDTMAEPAETFSLDLSNQTSGTIVDGQAVVTILDRPVGPPPPGPPPPPAPPPPPPPPPPVPPPPPAPVRCVVPRVTGLTLGRAKSRIRAKHCGVGRVRRVHSRRVGRVLKQSPRPGARKPRGAKVSLTVGRR